MYVYNTESILTSRPHPLAFLNSFPLLTVNHTPPTLSAFSHPPTVAMKTQNGCLWSIGARRRRYDWAISVKKDTPLKVQQTRNL
jgi:hypothetical protein